MKQEISLMRRSFAVLLIFAGLFCGAGRLLAQPVPPSSVMPPVRYVTVYGQRMAYYDLSNGPVLVLIHGFGTSAAIEWAQVIRPLSQHYRVIAIDNIGFGLSDKPNIAYTTQTFVDFLAEFLRELNITHFNLAGESMGGLIAALYAAESAAPGASIPIVDKVVLSDAAIFDPKGPVSWPPVDHKPTGLVPNSIEEYRQGLANGLFVNPAFATEAYARDVYQMLLTYHSAPTAAALFSGAGGTKSQDYLRDHLKDIRIPTLIIWGQNDKLIPVSSGDYIHQTIAGSKLIVVPECGHAPGMEKPAVYLENVLPFLDQ
jgi:2-hydroxy-6-oxonona-2,4-dienedioate hydrolase